MKPKKAARKISIAQAKLLEQHLTKTPFGTKTGLTNDVAKVAPKKTVPTVSKSGKVAPKQTMGW